METKVIYLIGFIFLFGTSYGQTGCTDSQALNYNSEALINDGSCIYENTSYDLNLVTNLVSPALNENSGIVYLNESIWVINDGGNSTELFQLDTLGNIQRQVFVQNVQNNDWEALTQNETHLFIGDFGNNSGSRLNLNIIRIPKASLLDPLIDTVSATILFFEYGDQDIFSGPSNGHNFDCEAFLAFQDSLYLFSKNWEDEMVKTYVLPLDWDGIYTAFPVESFNIDGLVTDVSIDSEAERLTLLGYKDYGMGIYSSFIWLLWDFSEPGFFSGNKRRIEIGSMLAVGQTEGISLSSSSRGYVSSEQISSIITIEPKLFSFEFELFFSESTLGVNPEKETIGYRVYPNPVTETLNLNDHIGAFVIYSQWGLIVQTGWSFGGMLDVSKLKPGIYVLDLKKRKVKFIKS
ncbi:MAG: T9SS type A sorting domain-containing protein [Crocinitomicaceae bacterium]